MHKDDTLTLVTHSTGITTVPKKARVFKQFVSGTNSKDKRTPTNMLARPQTVEEWMERMESKSLTFLQDQTSPYVRGHNGNAYDAAVMELVKNKMAAGETVQRIRPTYVVQRAEEEGEVEIVSYGGKGGSLRIVHPKE